MGCRRVPEKLRRCRGSSPSESELSQERTALDSFLLQFLRSDCPLWNLLWHQRSCEPPGCWLSPESILLPFDSDNCDSKLRIDNFAGIGWSNARLDLCLRSLKDFCSLTLFRSTLRPNFLLNVFNSVINECPSP